MSRKNILSGVFAILILPLLVLNSACAQNPLDVEPDFEKFGMRDPKDVKAFFGKGKFGFDPDYGLAKQSVFVPEEWDLVAVFFSSGEKNCKDAAKAIMASAGGNYRCTQLNN